MREPPITHGEVTRTAQIGAFRITCTDHGPDQRVQLHAHAVAALSIPLLGGFVEIVEDRRLECTPGNVLFKAAGAVHENRYSAEGARSLILEIPRSLLDDLAGTMEIRNVVAEVTHGVPWATALRLHRAVRKAPDAAAIDLQEIVGRLIGEGLERIGEPSLRPPRWLAGVRDRLEAELRDPPGLADLAADAGVHPVHLARTFRRHYGCSVGELVHRRRIDRAVVALVRTDEAIARMAVRLGFYDQPHLTRFFRRLSGYTPAAFRGMARRTR